MELTRELWKIQWRVDFKDMNYSECPNSLTISQHDNKKKTT